MTPTATTDLDLDGLRDLLRRALRFCSWAAGEGICPAEGGPAEDPSEFMMVYSFITGDDDWTTLPDRLPVALLDRLSTAEAERDEARRKRALLQGAYTQAVKALGESQERATAAEARAAELAGALTPSAETKAAYMGEFSFKREITFVNEDGDDETAIETITVPWDTIKQIMAAIRARATLSQQPDPAKGEREAPTGPSHGEG